MPVKSSLFKFVDMMPCRKFNIVVLTALLGALQSVAAAPQTEPIPLTRAHSHNDYEQQRPLFAALDQGFGSVEADIYVVDGELLVAHDRGKVTRERTLESLYLKPLQERVRQNGGRVYRGGPPVILLIDIKSDANATYAVLRRVLEKYSSILTRFSDGQVQTNAITAILSGNRPRTVLSGETTRYAALDGRPEDLTDAHQAPVALIPLVSEDWKSLFAWRGAGELPPGERQRLRGLVEQTHRQGRILRFWGAPDTVAVWGELYKSGVDLLNADDLPALGRFLREQVQAH